MDAQRSHPLAELIHGMAGQKELKPKAPDWRIRAWDDARAIATSPAQARDFMALAGWWRKRGCTDPDIHARAFRVIAQGKIANPMAYFSLQGGALNSIESKVAVGRHEDAKAEWQAEDEAAGFCRRKP